MTTRCRIHGICVTWRETRGNRKTASQRRSAPESVFEAASLSKPVFAYAVLKRVQEGKMDLDAPVMKCLSQGYEHKSRPYRADSQTERVSDHRLQAVTVRMALNHTFGLPNWSSGLLAFNLPPGEKWQYSGEGYVLFTNSEGGLALAESFSRTVITGGAHKVLRFHLLRDGLAKLLYETIDGRI